MKARLAIAGLVAAVAALVTGCGSSSSTQPPTVFTPTATATSGVMTPSGGGHPPVSETPTPVRLSPQPTVPATSHGVSECTRAMLTANLGLAQGAAGSLYEPIVFTNVSGAACWMRGYPGVSAVNASLAQLGVPAVRVVQDLKTITLQPGQSATATLQIVNALNFPVSSCGTAKTSAFLRIIPPDATSSIYDSLHVPMCVTPLHILFIGPVT
jgi:hypothetical protein